MESRYAVLKIGGAAATFHKCTHSRVSDTRRALAFEHSCAAGFRHEISSCRAHQFCKILASAQLAIILSGGTNVLASDVVDLAIENALLETRIVFVNRR